MDSVVALCAFGCNARHLYSRAMQTVPIDLLAQGERGDRVLVLPDPLPEAAYERNVWADSVMIRMQRVVQRERRAVGWRWLFHDV